MIPPRQIRARYDERTITVYQAYNRQIGEYAAAHGRFAPSYNRERMTWIKPSFLWMMYRSGWAAKADQECVLAIQITRAGFEWALAHSGLSHFDSAVHADRNEWAATRHRPVRVQWDPERSLTMQRLPHRSLQMGLSREAVHRYVDEWIVGIEDVTDLAHRIHALLRDPGSCKAAESALPAERPYPLPEEIAATCGMRPPKADLGAGAASGDTWVDG
ncbi:hypothetical protein Aph01nite_44530 [Acrocarpospora phusangensis]|uniref:DUF4291 domain-containing protein n=1 Tax=Acrocarpospora phusangensis TaxID=1070424 RepID=A0A919QEQ9_9ACTN|nr:DUF4291 domain-containing protein [Acrocarpospora phusangensis]GIH26143.1 hypothetical protein Aph01nite_44530 [Acrocarpospora phusangensis]